jgi:hypothetical protein
VIDAELLRSLILEHLKKSPQTQFSYIQTAVRDLLAKQGAFPSEDECKKNGLDYTFYRGKQLNPQDQNVIRDIVWDLIVERVLTIGSDTANTAWPFLRVTKFGESIVNNQAPHYSDPEGWIARLDSLVPSIDSVIRQYLREALEAFRRNLTFASAVMLGAASEKAVLLLLDSMAHAVKDQKRAAELQDLLDRPRLPRIFEAIQTIVDDVRKSGAMPYDVHQGAIVHLNAFFESIRVQRNDAVHPEAGRVSREKVYISLHAFPKSMQVLYRLLEWFQKHPF